MISLTNFRLVADEQGHMTSAHQDQHQVDNQWPLEANNNVPTTVEVIAESKEASINGKQQVNKFTINNKICRSSIGLESGKCDRQKRNGIVVVNIGDVDTSCDSNVSNKISVIDISDHDQGSINSGASSRNDSDSRSNRNFKSDGSGTNQSEGSSGGSSGEPANNWSTSNDNETPHFTITWQDLSFTIKPKWPRRIQYSSMSQGGEHLKPATYRDRLAGRVNSWYNWARGEPHQHQSASNETSVGKRVLDSLDGSFSSGQLTAILGPSGAGKTTLLDCLTGRRKQGLHGTIRMTSTGDAQTPDSSLARQTNLKVSIIPQNDHLIGHLTVRETLNYASKMKNYDHYVDDEDDDNNGQTNEKFVDGSTSSNKSRRRFDHAANIRRVTQQLGLCSCLNTRIKKLSGGQYKRVSIAQELLSNPDILILDEPTSGLDAMTCYQTVQVLRRLADSSSSQSNSMNAMTPPEAELSTANGTTAKTESIDKLPTPQFIHDFRAGGVSNDSRAATTRNGSSSRRRSIAIILTIHQPNHDVINQFHKVYVVAHGGRCIYEGPPSNIVETINKVGLKLPNEIYNPATMIVEVAAGKFGQQPMSQLNHVQKKQYRPSSHPNSSQPGSTDSRKIQIADSNSDDQQCNSEITNHITAHDNPAFTMQDSKDDTDATDKTSQTVKPNRPMRHNQEKRLKLNSLGACQDFPFWRHTYLHFHRSWLSIVRDPMLCGMQLFLHISVPIMVSLVYGSAVGRPNACPRAGPVDLIQYALEPEDSALNLQEELRTTLENIGYIFFKLYGIIFAAMTVTVLTFPLDMHVLIKEHGNGWYGLSSYFLGRTLADIPFQLTLPLLAVSLSYYATGQPYSYMQWRFLSITGILILSSLIAQSQGLLFGALLMDRMKAAVFVAPAATTPIILFAGFLVRTQSIPYYLRPLSNLSYLRYAIEACLISRYGFNQCDCDPSIFNQTVPELPPVARTMIDYWLTSFKTPGSGYESDVTSNSTLSSLVTTTSAPTHTDLFGKLIDSLGRANSFGRNITSCEQVVPYPMIDYNLQDSQLLDCFTILTIMLIFTRLLTFFIVCFKVKRKV